MLIGVTVTTDVFFDVTMLSGRLLPSSGILKKEGMETAGFCKDW